MSQARSVFAQYAVYVGVGVGVTLVGVALRSLFGMVVPDDSRLGYQATIVLAYVFGVPLSFVAHRSVTFRGADPTTLPRVGTFVGIHLLGMVANLAGSTWLRETLLGAGLGDESSKSLAFGIVAFAVSIVSFVLKKLFVFVRGSAADAPAAEPGVIDS